MGGARSSRRDFPSFWEGLSLRLQVIGLGNRFVIQHFPSFWEGLSLRLLTSADPRTVLFISLPFGKGFH